MLKRVSVPQCVLCVTLRVGAFGCLTGTQCNLLVESSNEFVHLSAGDLLREERERGGEVGDMIEHYIKEGLIVPHEVTIGLLKRRMLETPEKSFLIDGFPRKLDQCLAFEETVCQARGCLVIDAPDEVILERLLERGKTSGRIDDNPETIQKRLDVYHSTTVNVYDHFEESDRLVRVDGTAPKEAVFLKVKAAVDGLISRETTSSAPSVSPRAPSPLSAVEPAASH